MGEIEKERRNVGPPEGSEREPGPVIQSVKVEPEEDSGGVDGVQYGS